jgi:hypothetical protein
VHRESFELPGREWRSIRRHLGQGLTAAALSIAITSQSGGHHFIDISDVRVQGQTPALKQFLSSYQIGEME